MSQHPSPLAYLLHHHHNLSLSPPLPPSPPWPYSQSSASPSSFSSTHLLVSPASSPSSSSALTVSPQPTDSTKTSPLLTDVACKICPSLTSEPPVSSSTPLLCVDCVCRICPDSSSHQQQEPNFYAHQEHCRRSPQGHCCHCVRLQARGEECRHLQPWSQCCPERAGQPRSRDSSEAQPRSAPAHGPVDRGLVVKAPGLYTPRLHALGHGTERVAELCCCCQLPVQHLPFQVSGPECCLSSPSGCTCRSSPSPITTPGVCDCRSSCCCCGSSCACKGCVCVCDEVAERKGVQEEARCLACWLSRNCARYSAAPAWLPATPSSATSSCITASSSPSSSASSSFSSSSSGLSTWWCSAVPLRPSLASVRSWTLGAVWDNGHGRDSVCCAAAGGGGAAGLVWPLCRTLGALLWLLLLLVLSLGGAPRCRPGSRRRFSQELPRWLLLVLGLVLALGPRGLLASPWIQEANNGKAVKLRAQFCRPVPDEHLRSMLGEDFDASRMSNDGPVGKRTGAAAVVDYVDPELDEAVVEYDDYVQDDPENGAGAKEGGGGGDTADVRGGGAGAGAGYTNAGFLDVVATRVRERGGKADARSREGVQQEQEEEEAVVEEEYAARTGTGYRAARQRQDYEGRGARKDSDGGEEIAEQEEETFFRKSVVRSRDSPKNRRRRPDPGQQQQQQQQQNYLYMKRKRRAAAAAKTGGSRENRRDPALRRASPSSDNRPAAPADYEDELEADGAEEEEEGDSNASPATAARDKKNGKDSLLPLRLMLSGRNRKLRRRLKKVFRKKVRKLGRKPVPWQCNMTTVWGRLSDDYFPRYVQDGRCTTDKCFYRLYSCVPQVYRIKLLRRDPDYCNPLPLLGNSTTTYEQKWTVERKPVIVGCNCVADESPLLRSGRRLNS